MSEPSGQKSKTAETELRRVRLLLGDAAAQISALPLTGATRRSLLQMVYQAEKAAERAVGLAREEER